MRTARVFVVVSMLVAGCSSSSSDGSSSGGDGGSTSSSSSASSSSSGGGGGAGFDACVTLTQTEAQDVIGYTLTPCRKEPVNDAVRHVWDSPADAPVAAIGSVNVTVEAKGASLAGMKALCGSNGAGCLTLPGVGAEAFLNLKLTGVTVKKGDAVFTAQCENPGQIIASDDAVIQERLTADNKKADETIRGGSWRNASSCSLAIARIVAGKLP